jgi:hypothetical protein
VVNKSTGAHTSTPSRGPQSAASRFLAIIISMAFHLDPGYQAAPYPE